MVLKDFFVLLRRSSVLGRRAGLGLQGMAEMTRVMAAAAVRTFRRLCGGGGGDARVHQPWLLRQPLRLLPAAVGNLARRFVVGSGGWRRLRQQRAAMR